jgi:cold shock CspA family protein
MANSAKVKAKAIYKSQPQSYKSYEPNKDSLKVQAQGFISNRDHRKLTAKTDCGIWRILFERSNHEYARLRGHICVIHEGTGVTFDLCKSNISNVRFDVDPVFADWEISFIRSWDRQLGRGLAARKCGCHIFIHWTNVESSQLDSLQSGIFISHKVKNTHNRITATEIAIYEVEVEVTATAA